MDVAERRGVTGFWLEQGWVRDVSNLAYSKCKGISDFFGEWSGFRFRGVYWFILNVGGVSGVVRWPTTNTNALLIACGDLEFRVGDEGVKSFIPPDEEPRIVDEFEG
jgi:hypothetical protein